MVDQAAVTSAGDAAAAGVARERLRGRYEAILDERPSHLVANFNLGVGVYDGVEALQERLDALPPSERRARKKLQSEIDRTVDEALRYIERAHDTDPEHALVNQTLGVIRERHGR